jgi:beta-1,2-mannobiose phosphorylase / 1,2-beta-oligomannan phosphorylase
VLHSIHPKIEIAYLDSLADFNDTHQYITSGYNRSITTEGRWDTWVRGAGPPPLRTDYGWLVLYHGIQKGETHKYKLGAMLLDLDEPTHVVARSTEPLLEPDMWYENHGKPGIVYATGSVVIDGILHVYYGAGDSSVCVATVPLETLCRSMLNGTAVHLKTEEVENVI